MRERGSRFDENYGLASTQSLKNKDIPEGGAKGTILPSWGSSSPHWNHADVDITQTWRQSKAVLREIRRRKHTLVYPSEKLINCSSPQSVLDLLIPGQSPGIKEYLVDLYNKPEILFLGPDGAPICFSNILGIYKRIFAEGTADMMDWAACTS